MFDQQQHIDLLKSRDIKRVKLSLIKSYTESVQRAVHVADNEHDIYSSDLDDRREAS